MSALSQWAIYAVESDARTAAGPDERAIVRRVSVLGRRAPPDAEAVRA